MELTTLDRYQLEALRTGNSYPDRDTRLSVLGLGIAGESGEVADLIKKVVGHGHTLDENKMLYELGDVLWYVANLADAIGVSLSTVATLNIEKLRARYPDGFDSERSQNRTADELLGNTQLGL